MKIYESGENYLETILRLSYRLENVRSIDVANELGYSKASVSRGMSILKEKGYINIGKQGHIKFTDNGKKYAESIIEKHKILTEFINKVLGVEIETAEADACRIEHVISEETFKAIKKELEDRICR